MKQFLLSLALLLASMSAQSQTDVFNYDDFKNDVKAWNEVFNSVSSNTTRAQELAEEDW